MILDGNRPSKNNNIINNIIKIMTSQSNEENGGHSQVHSLAKLSLSLQV